MSSWLRNALVQILFLLCRFLFRVEIKGRLDESGILIANHLSYLDGVLLFLFLRPKPVFVVAADIFKNPFFRWALGAADCLAVNPKNPSFLKEALHMLAQNRSIVIFPEGRRSVTGSLMKVYRGPAFLAQKSQKPLIPVRLDGTGDFIWGARFLGKKRLRPKMTIYIGKAIVLSRLSSHEEKAFLRRLMEETCFATRPSQTIGAALLDAARRFGRFKTVLSDPFLPPLSYFKLFGAMALLERHLKHKTPSKEKIGILLPTASVGAMTIFAVMASGRTPVLFNYAAGHESLGKAMGLARLRILLTSRRFLEIAKLKIPPFAGQVVYIEDILTSASLGARLYALWFALFPHFLAQHPKDPAVILFTSGSEGVPKGVVLSHEALLANVRQVQAVIDIHQDDVFFSVLPLFHAFGLTAGLILPLLSGSRAHLYPTPLHFKTIPDEIYRQDATILLGTSTFLHHYGQTADPLDMQRLRAVVAGAEKLQEETAMLWHERFGIAMLEGYGTTEAAPVVSVNTFAFRKKGSVGKLLPGMEAAIVPFEGFAKGGELYLKGPNLMLGLLDPSDEELVWPKSALGSDWYPTGDIAEMDEEGFLFIIGRKKRFAKVAGEMVPLDAIEHFARCLDPEGSHAAVALPSGERGEIIVLVTTNQALSLESIKNMLEAEGLPNYMLPRLIVHEDDIPRLPTGKANYPQVMSMLAAKHFTSR